MAPSAPSPGRRVVVYYQTQYHNNNYVSPTPLIPVATHLIVAAFHLNKDKTIHLNNVPPDDSSLNQMWVDVARMQGKVLGGASDDSYSYLDADFGDYYDLLSSCIAA